MSAPPAEDLLAAVFRSLPDGAVLTRFPDRVVSDVNPALCALFGYAREEIVGRTTQMLHVDAAHYEAFGVRIAPAFRDGQSVRLVWPMRRKDGSVFQASVTVSPVRAFEGAPVGAVAILRDLEPEEEARARSSMLAEHAHDLIIRTDTEGRIGFVSPSVRALLGYEPEELRGQETWRIVVPEDRAAALGGSDAPARTYRMRLARKDGSIVWAENVSVPLVGVDGKHAGRLGIVRDVTRQVEAEDALRASEARWRSLVEGAADYIYTVDREARVLFVNRAAPGRSRDSIVGTRVWEWSPPELHDEIRGHYEEAFRTGQPVTYLTTLASDGGAPRVYETRVAPIPSEGRVESAVAVSREITERRELRVTEAKLRRLTESGILGVAIGDFEGRILEANDAFLAAIGHARAEVDAGTLRWNAITPPEHNARDDEAMAELRERGRASPYEKEYIRADGTRAQVLVGVAMLPEDEGHSIAFAVDVSARRAAEAAMRSEQRLAQTVLDAQSALGEGIILVEMPGGRAIHTNEAIAELTGWSREEILAMPNVLQAVTPDEHKEVWASRFATLARGEEVEPRFESWIKRKDGASLAVEIVGTNVVYQDRPCRLYVLRDLTAQRAAQRQLELARSALAQSEKLAALGTLVSGVAHEARTPMTAMMNASHLLQARIARGEADAQLAPLLESIVENAERLKGFVDELRRFTRMSAEARETLSLDVPVRDALRLFAQTHPGEGTVEAQLAPTPPIRANALRVTQIVLNLVQNAADASNGAPVRVTTRPTSEGGAVLLVEDEGEGMTEIVRARMFDPLFTTKPHGTGLGLAIVKRIAEEHGARIEVDSAPGKGTRIRVRFPPADRSGSP